MSTSPTIDTKVASNDTSENTADVQRPTRLDVSFDNIDPLTFHFDPIFKCSLSTAGQVIQGLYHLSQSLNGEGVYESAKKEPKNEYQKLLYPKISELSTKTVMRYREMFVDNITDPLQKQVYGANLNGIKNNGQLNKFITCSSVDDKVRYKFAQFGQLLSLLEYRLTFIIKRNISEIQRYNENENERVHFESLRLLSEEFCKFLKDIFAEWSAHVDESRRTNGYVPQPHSQRKFGRSFQYRPVRSDKTPEPVKLSHQNVEQASNEQDENWSSVRSDRPRYNVNRRGRSGRTVYNSSVSGTN